MNAQAERSGIVVLCYDERVEVSELAKVRCNTLRLHIGDGASNPADGSEASSTIEALRFGVDGPDRSEGMPHQPHCAPLILVVQRGRLPPSTFRSRLDHPWLKTPPKKGGRRRKSCRRWRRTSWME
eukprot:1350105-Pyramimonas_sp.AAC.1